MKSQLVLIATAVTLSACSGTSETNKAQTDAVPVSPSPAKEVQKAQSDLMIPKDDTAKTDKVILLVKNITEPNIDRSGSSVTKPEDNEKYICIQVWMKNVSNEETKVFEDDVKLFDQDDAEFTEHRGFTEHRKKPILFDEEPVGVTLKPNQSKSGWITFTTDVKSKASKISYSNIIVNLIKH